MCFCFKTEGYGFSFLFCEFYAKYMRFFDLFVLLVTKVTYFKEK